MLENLNGPKRGPDQNDQNLVQFRVNTRLARKKDQKFSNCKPSDRTNKMSEFIFIFNATPQKEELMMNCIFEFQPVCFNFTR